MKGTIVFSITNYIAGDQRMHRICSALLHDGFNVCLIGRKDISTPSLQQYAFAIQEISCFFKKGKGFYLEYNFRLFWRLLFTKADILGAVDLDTILPVLLVSKVKRKKLTYDAHEYFTEVPEVYERPVTKKIWKWVEQFALPKTDAQYTVAESIAGLFREEYDMNFVVIRNVSPFKKNQSGTAGEKFILYQGALNRGRGLEQLIEAMCTLDIVLKIAGRGDVEGDLRDMVEKLGLREKVIFLGFLKPEELDSFGPHAYLGYNLLENQGKSYYYSLANKTFDYMQAGLPVLCSPYPEYVALHQVYPFICFSDLSVSDIVSTVNRLLDHPEEYNRLKSAALDAKGILNWEFEQVKLVEIYNKLLSEG